MDEKNQADHLPQSAGKNMISNVPLVHADNSAADVINNIEKRAASFKTINYIYVIDKDRQLIGVVSLKKIFGIRKSTAVKDIMTTNIVSVTPDTDQEKVALLALRYNLKSIPVVSKNNAFLGIVASDTILSILHSEAIEDVLLTAGVHTFEDPAKSIIKASTTTHIKKRIPWLILGLGGGIGAAMIVDGFEEVLKTHILLAAFIPTVVYMADAVGTQTQTIFIRSLSMDHSLNIVKYIWRESKVGLALAAILGAITTALTLVLWQSVPLSAIFGLSLLASILLAMIVAIIMPLSLYKAKMDPAVASGPFATVISDLLSIFIYFAVVQLMLQFFTL